MTFKWEDGTERELAEALNLLKPVCVYITPYFRIETR